MERTVNTIEIGVPADLADILYESGLARESPDYRSSIPQLIADGLTVATTTISLAQGPLTVAQTAGMIRKWRETRRLRGQNRVKISIDGARGHLEFEIDEKADIDEIAAQIRNAMFPPTQVRPNSDPDDIL